MFTRRAIFRYVLAAFLGFFGSLATLSTILILLRFTQGGYALRALPAQALDGGLLYERQWTVRNLWPRPLQVNVGATSCSCVRHMVSKGRLGLGETAVVTLDVSSIGKPGAFAEKGMLELARADIKHIEVLTVSGKAFPGVYFMPDAISLPVKPSHSGYDWIVHAVFPHEIPSSDLAFRANAFASRIAVHPVIDSRQRRDRVFDEMAVHIHIPTIANLIPAENVFLLVKDTKAAALPIFQE